MRLPDSFLDDLRNRLSLSQVVGRKVTWDMKKTNQSKGDWWAPCPFHQEKTASFHVDDRKGFYYCFGCQAKGNLFGFVQETENVGFMEAVEILAAEAGMGMPERDPRAAQTADLRTRLAEVTEEAVRWFRLQLQTGAGSHAREYLDGRGLSRQTQERFEIGFAPDASDAFLRDMAAKGIPFDLLEGAGLAVAAEDGRPARDRFIHRIIFPIRDARGRCIGFGGRAMNPNAKAKYLNSPETALFDKGANLYNLGPARTAAGKGQPLIVAEGYMDVIALNQAGFEACVAPLGTAVTERQLQMLWRVSPEPLIALDGDAAGQRAGLRVADLALPLMQAGQSLRFAILPEGCDPDDLIRDKGASAMQEVLDAARPMISLLWQRETGDRSFDSPERRAMLDRDLRAVLRRIADPSLRRHYGDEIARLRGDLFGVPPRRPDGPRTSDRPFVPGRRWQAPAGASATARASGLASGQFDGDAVLEQVVLAGLVTHPALIAEMRDRIELADWSRPELGRLATALLDVDPGSSSAETRETVAERIGAEALELVLAQRHVRISPVVRSDLHGARVCILDAWTKLAARHGANREAREAMEDFAEGADEAMTWRLVQAARRRDAAQRASRADEATDADEAGLSEYLQGLLDTKVWEKTKRK
ncbi:DNA primase [Jannaschia sp. S6380]|uniref:DNA primase n=1 Tax=Jannaschia sp. S6380 TaxID=2926408 RepID=UPI001FF55620|nr:DNA primase [Jannaschia sp. S6380]MCK0169327.1 DNA primase [Jannaschia sp. S6380]